MTGAVGGQRSGALPHENNNNNNKLADQNDANNNEDQSHNNNNNNIQDRRFPMVRRQKAIEEEEEAPMEEEEWQVLEVTPKTPKAPNGVSEKKQQRKFIELDPLAADKLKSPLLIHLVTAIYSLMPLASLLAAFLLFGLLFTRHFYLPLAYIAYVLWDRNSCNRGGHRLQAVYKSPFWSYLAAYFPIKLRHSAQFKLDPKQNYILNYHPHGISAFGAVTCLATDGLQFTRLFPGITARFMCHETSFVTPVMRETFLSRGDCSVNSKSIDFMLERSKGNLLTIVVGGLAEADLSEAQVLKTVIMERKGFVKKALLHGAHLVPCISFGENSVFHKVNLEPGSLLHRMESRWYQLFKFKHPIYYGRSMFSGKWSGVMPWKRPITVVLGDPIEVERVERPSQADIDQLHARYVRELRATYEANRDLCAHYDRRLEML